MAHQVGLDIPPTVLTNDPEEAGAFVARSAGDTVFKAHSQNLNLEYGKALYTGVVKEKELSKLDLIRVSPGIFQQLVAKSYEVRATVVGSRIFSGSPWIHMCWPERRLETDVPPRILRMVLTLSISIKVPITPRNVT